METAPGNGGFTVETEGWVRVRLAEDEHQGSDIWAIPGRPYPLKVAEYELPGGTAASGISWLSENLGGYRISKTFDEGETADIQDSLGFYSGGTGSLSVDGSSIALAAGDFWAGHGSEVAFNTINFITAIW